MLAEGLNLVDEIKDLRTALHDQAKRALEPATTCPATRSRRAAPCATGATKSAAFNALSGIGLDYDDVIEESDALAQASRAES